MNEADRILLEIDLGRTTESAKEAAKALDTVAAAVKKTADSYQLLEKETKEYTLAVTQVDAAMDKEVAAAVEATRAHRFYAQVLDEHKAKLAAVTTTTNAAIGTGGKGGVGMMGISYAVQDFTSQINNGLVPALGAIQNNVPMIAMALGAETGLAAKISLITVGLGLALPLLSKMFDTTDKVGDNAEDAAKKLLGFNDQLERLNAAGKALAEAKPAAEEEATKAIGAAVKAAGERTIKAGLSAMLAEQDAAGAEAELRRRLTTGAVGAEMQGASPAEKEEIIRRERADITQQSQATLPTRVQNIMGGLASGSEDTRQRVEAMARARPKLFGAGTADLLARASPQTQQAEAQIRARNAAAAFGAQVDFDEMEFARVLPDTPPPFFSRRLPVGRIDQGPLAAGERPGVETPAQRRARLIAQLQARPRPNVMGPQGEPEFRSEVYAPTYRPRRARPAASDESRRAGAEDRARTAFQRDAAAATLRQSAGAMVALTTTNAMVAGTLAQVQLELKRVAEENARLQRQMKQRQAAQMRRTGQPAG